MIGFLIDIILILFIATVAIVAIQFQTGWLTGKTLKIWKYRFRVDREEKKRILYSFWKEE